MDLELRDITDDEFPAYSRVTEAAFGVVPSDEEVERWRSFTHDSHKWAAFDDGEIVGTGGAFAFDLTLPGGGTVPAGGLTAIGVRSTHRRRGILTSMMDLHLDACARTGQPLSILTASESVIYGRYGYGSAADLVSWTLPTEGTELAVPPRAEGRLRIVDATRAREVLPVVYDAHRLVTPGALTRSPAFWDFYFEDPADDRNGASARFFVVHEDRSGTPDGYAAYRIKDSWTDGGLPGNELRAYGVVASDPEVEVALWEHLLSVDLVRTVVGSHRPDGDLLRWRLADPRRLQQKTRMDHLWVRILDVPTALGARAYGVADRLVLDVTDPFRPTNNGRYLLDGGPDGATCLAAGDAEPDLALGIADLGALFLGGVRASTLARAGRVEERSPEALRRADALFAWSTPPWCATGF